MSAASWALQQAVFAALGADAGVIALLGAPPRVYDDVPRDAAMPYLVIGEGGENDWSTKTEPGTEHVIAIHVWSRGAGMKECKQLADAVRVALDGADTGVSGVVGLRFQNAAFTRESDGRTLRAILRFRALFDGL